VEVGNGGGGSVSARSSGGVDTVVPL